jgi:hypothetical protein
MDLLALQANLVGRGNVPLHRVLRLSGLFIAVGVVRSIVWVFVEFWQGWDVMHVVGKVNRIFLPSYALFVIAGFLSRQHPSRHKRLMFIASLYMLESAPSRAFDPFEPLLVQFTENQIDAALGVFSRQTGHRESSWRFSSAAMGRARIDNYKSYFKRRSLFCPCRYTQIS